MKINSDRLITVIICTAAILFGVIVKAMPSYYYWQGTGAFKKKNYKSAYTNLEKAYKHNRNNTDYRYYYVQSMLKIPPTVKVQKDLFEISTSEKEDSAKQIAKDKITEWKNNVLQNIGNNYIEQAPYNNAILRWDAKSFPLKVFVTDQSETTLPPYYKDEINRAFIQWENSTNFIKFKLVDKQNNANIIVKILPLPGNVCDSKNCKYAVGYTTPNIKHNILKNMTIVLYSKDPYENFFSDKELYNTILHEIGHALGIMGHSYSSEDLMYMASNGENIYTKYRSSFQYLSSKDINTVKLLYKLVPTISDTENIDMKGLIYPPIILGTNKDISNKKLEEAKDYIKKAPDLASGYIDMSIAYAELGKSKDAVKALEKALELSKNNSEKYLCLYNLAALHIEIKKYDKAKEYAIQAQQIFDNEDVKDLLSKIKLEKNK